MNDAPKTNDDLDFVRSHVEDYPAYDNERERHDSDLRIRAFVGERLTAARERLGAELDEATTKTLDDVLMRCMFSDQVFVRKFEHARLDATMTAALVRSDRSLIEFGKAAATATAAEFHDLLVEIDKQFEYRRAPEPLAG